jgi:hypothetical protein
MSHRLEVRWADSVDRVIPVSAPPRVRERLRSTPDGPVELLHRGPDAVYVAVSDWCVGVVGSRATAVPCALRSGLDTLPPVVSASVRGGELVLDGVPLRIGRLVDVSVPRLRLAGDAASIDAASIEVADLVGRGDGLTPYGDDVLCGWLAVHRAAGIATPAADDAVRDVAHTTTLLSATLLDCALHGEVIPEFAAWLATHRTADEGSAATALARVGHTSGRGLLEGARRALDELERVAA